MNNNRRLFTSSVEEELYYQARDFGVAVKLIFTSIGFHGENSIRSQLSIDDYKPQGFTGDEFHLPEKFLERIYKIKSFSNRQIINLPKNITLLFDILTYFGVFGGSDGAQVEAHLRHLYDLASKKTEDRCDTQLALPNTRRISAQKQRGYLKNLIDDVPEGSARDAAKSFAAVLFDQNQKIDPIEYREFQESFNTTGRQISFLNETKSTSGIEKRKSLYFLYMMEYFSGKIQLKNEQLAALLMGFVEDSYFSNQSKRLQISIAAESIINSSITPIDHPAYQTLELHSRVNSVGDRNLFRLRSNLFKECDKHIAQAVMSNAEVGLSFALESRHEVPYWSDRLMRIVAFQLHECYLLGSYLGYSENSRILASWKESIEEIYEKDDRLLDTWLSTEMISVLSSEKSDDLVGLMHKIIGNNRIDEYGELILALKINLFAEGYGEYEPVVDLISSRSIQDVILFARTYELYITPAALRQLRHAVLRKNLHPIDRTAVRHFFDR